MTSPDSTGNSPYFSIELENNVVQNGFIYRRAYDSMDGADCLLIFVAIIFPPAAVAFVSGCGCDLFVNILLTLLGYIPGLIHALWLVFQRANAQERYNAANYAYTDTGTYAPATQPSHPQPNPYPSGNAPPAYKG